MPGVFISYRRQDSAGHAGRLFDGLQPRLGRERVFMDVAAIDAGVDFVQTLEGAVGSCDVLLAVIGPKWLPSADDRRRLDDPTDFVRIEIATALRRNVRVIPVLVSGARLPSPQELPDDLQALARRQAVELRDTRWDADIADLVASLERQLGGARVSARARRIAIVAVLAIAALTIGVAARYLAAPTPQPVTASAEPELSLTYAITARENPREHPDSIPVLLAQNHVLSAGDLVRLSFRSAGQGFLYVLNESPSAANRDQHFNILFPSPTSNGGSARLSAGGEIAIPERGDGFELDAEEGSERLWLVWSANPVNELDAVTHWANPRDGGEIKSTQDVALVRNFLTLHASPAPRVETLDGVGTALKARGQMFVKLVTLDHR